MNDPAQPTVDQRTERRRAQWRASYHRHKEENAVVHRACATRRFWAKRDEVLEQNRAWRKAHPYASLTEEQKEGLRLKNRKWVDQHREEQRERWRSKGRRRHAEQHQRVLQINRDWRRRNPMAIKVRDQKRRALKAKAAVNLVHITEWMAAVKSKPFARCYYCNAKVSTDKIHFDHMIPLSKGGPHSVENLCVSCVLCNLSKGAKQIDEWQREGQQVLGL